MKWSRPSTYGRALGTGSIDHELCSMIISYRRTDFTGVYHMQVKLYESYNMTHIIWRIFMAMI